MTTLPMRSECVCIHFDSDCTALISSAPEERAMDALALPRHARAAQFAANEIVGDGDRNRSQAMGTMRGSLWCSSMKSARA
jgi:hypothetical protein